MSKHDMILRRSRRLHRTSAAAIKRLAIQEAAEPFAVLFRTSYPLTAQEMGPENLARFLQQYFRIFGRFPLPVDAVEKFDEAALRAGIPPDAIVVACFEAAMRECGEPGPNALTIGELQCVSGDDLLRMRVRRYPATRIIEVGEAAPATLLGLYPNLKDCAAIILTVRASGVLVLPLAADELAMLATLSSERVLFDILVGTRANRRAPSTFHRLVRLGVIQAMY